MGASYFSGPNFLDVGQIELGEEANLGTLRRISPMVATNEQQVAALAPSSSAAPITSIGAGTEPTIFDVVKKEFGSAKPRGDFSIDVAPFERESRLQPIIDPIDEEFEENFGGVIFDPGLDFDPSGRTDPDSPNFDPVAVGQNVLGEIFASPEDPTPQSILDLATDRNTSARSISQALQQNLQKGQQGFNIFSKTNEFISKALGLPTIDEKKSDAIQRAILGAAEAERQREQYAGRGAVEQAQQARSQAIRSDESRMQQGQVDFDIPTIEVPDTAQGASDVAAGYNITVKDGGQVPSFMNMRK